MIGRDQVNYPFAKALPERFAILATANWRRTLMQRGAVRYFVGTQMQVVRAGFHRDGKSAALGVLQPG
jgi:hypothetical protein